MSLDITSQMISSESKIQQVQISYHRVGGIALLYLKTLQKPLQCKATNRFDSINLLPLPPA
jgi:hypothetical protein